MRAEGWAFYLEEMLLQAGLLDGRPRSRELFYLFQLQRAVRIPGEIRMLSGEWTLEQAIAFWMNEVPMMDENLARTELQLYLRNPLNGIAYTIGKALLEGLLADRSRQLGDQFDLGAFHDQLLAAPWIPFSLIRWEMTGLDDEVRPFWEDVRRDRAEPRHERVRTDEVQDVRRPEERSQFWHVVAGGRRWAAAAVTRAVESSCGSPRPSCGES